METFFNVWTVKYHGWKSYLLQELYKRYAPGTKTFMENAPFVLRLKRSVFGKVTPDQAFVKVCCFRSFVIEQKILSQLKEVGKKTDCKS